MFIGRWQPWHKGHRWLIDQRLNDGKNVLINLYPSKESQYISSQELITEDWYEDWYTTLKENNFLRSKIVGYSVQNRPIKAFFSKDLQPNVQFC